VASVTEQDRIRDTYRSYEATGRERLWDRANRGFRRLADERDAAVAILLAQSLPAGPARLLDVGCGDGTLIGTVLAIRPEVRAVGLDLLRDKIGEATAAVPEATFVVGSADALPFAADAFDIVSAITLFSSIPDPDMEAGAATEIGRVLRPGGWLIWYDLRYDNPSNPAVHGLSSRRLAELFPGWQQELRTFTVAPPIARRLGILTPVAYPVLNAIPPIRSHLVGRLRRPDGI
jgi:ubiquinone/menaquinone biosynthesis C-methylase UbiE